MFLMMYGFVGVLVVIGIVLALLGILYVLTVTGVLGNLLAGLGDAIVGFLGRIFIGLGALLVELLKIIALPALIIGGIVFLVWMIRKAFF